MRSTRFFLLLFVVFACGGNSRELRKSRGNGTSGSSGTSGEGSGGSSGGSRASGGSDARGGASTEGGTAGTGARGGTAGTDDGMAGEPSGGTGARGGTGSGATGGTAGTPTGGTSTGGTGAMPAITSCTDEFPFAGAWVGNILDFYFEPMEELELIVTPDEELDGYQGTLRWGSGDPPPPVTSGDEPYPPGFWDNLDEIDGLNGIDPWPGFEYSVVRGAGCDATFRVSVSIAEIWDEWCSLQTPVYTESEGVWGCTYRGGGSSNSQTCDVQDGRGNVLATYPIWKCKMCGTFSFEGGVCACDEAGCFFNRQPTHTFDLTLQQSGGVDVLRGPDARCGDCTVRLERTE